MADTMELETRLDDARSFGSGLASLMITTLGPAAYTMTPAQLQPYSTAYATFIFALRKAKEGTWRRSDHAELWGNTAMQSLSHRRWQRYSRILYTDCTNPGTRMRFLRWRLKTFPTLMLNWRDDLTLSRRQTKERAYSM